MPMYFCKRTNRHFIQFNYKGKTIKRRLPHGTTKEDADKLEVKIKHELFFESNGITERHETLWETFVDRVYLEYVAANNPASLEKAIVICKASLPFLKGMSLRAIKPAHLEKFKASRLNTLTRHGHVRKPSTVHREMSIISRVFSMAVDNDLCDYNPVSRVRLPTFDNTQDRILEMVDEEKFFLSFRNSLQRDICRTVVYTGLRQNDVLALSDKHINWDRKEIVLTQGKTKRIVKIPMNEVVQEILERRTGKDLFFPSYRSGNKLLSIKNGIRFACIRAGIPLLTIRDLRRTFGTWLHELGFDDATIASLLGHSDLRSVHRYKRGKAIKFHAVAALENRGKIASMSANLPNGLGESAANCLENMVEMRRIELLASALRTNSTPMQIH